MDKEKLLEIGIKKRKKEISQSWEALNTELGYPFKSGETFRKWTYNRVKDKGSFKYNNEDNEEEYHKSSHSIKSDGTHTSEKLLRMNKDQEKDPEYLLIAHGFSTDSWELVSARNNEWNVYSKQDGIQTLYSSKIVAKPKTKFSWDEKNAQKVFDSLKTNNNNKTNIYPKQYEKNGNILLLPIPDFHYGLYAENHCTGNDYNLEIAEKNYFYTLKDICSKVSNRKFEKVLFIVGNDFVNSDNLQGTTTKGTPQDNASFWYNIVEKSTQLIIDGIDMLANISPVDVEYVPSNHDLHTMFGIMQTISAWYRKDSNVKIGTSPMERKYYKFGKNLIGLSHDIKIKNALKLFTTEAKKDWSNSNHMFWFLAHKHKAMIYDKQGYLEIMRLPTISGWSRWTNKNEYVQTEKKNQSFIINSELGITDILNTIIQG
ncbi:MAG: hypothetical protein ACOCUI_03030 [bacterium]